MNSIMAYAQIFVCTQQRRENHYVTCVCRKRDFQAQHNKSGVAIVTQFISNKRDLILTQTISNFLNLPKSYVLFLFIVHMCYFVFVKKNDKNISTSNILFMISRNIQFLLVLHSLSSQGVSFAIHSALDPIHFKKIKFGFY